MQQQRMDQTLGKPVKQYVGLIMILTKLLVNVSKSG